MNRDLVASLAWAAGSVSLAIVATSARKMGFIEGETATRLVIGSNGLMIAYFGNLMPKLFVPSECARRTRRVGGWAMVLSGIVYTAVFAFAPMPVAVRVGVFSVLAGISVTLAYGVWLRSKTIHA